jgi:glycogen debranching enzyme
MRQSQKTSFYELQEIAKKSLLANIVSIGNSQFLCAGAHHFKSLWTRDFCWSIGGLIAAGKSSVAASHVQALIHFKHPDNHNIPRIIDTLPSKLRISYSIAAQYLPEKLQHLPMKGELNAEYKGEHGTYSFDANSLLVLGAFQIAKTPEYSHFLTTNKQALINIIKFYEPYLKDGLVYQQKYGDWQDSIAREGVSFYSNLLYWWALNLLNQEFAIGADKQLQSLKHTLQEKFFDKETGLFKTHLGYDNYSIDGQLIAIESDFVTGAEANDLYQNLKASPLWSGCTVPGMSSYPNYPKQVKSLITRFVGLLNYHDDMIWSWLTGYSIRVAAKMHDVAESQRIIEELARMAKRDSYIFEIYSPKPPQNLFKTPLYQSEGPFSWGSGQILQSLAQIETV